MSKRSDGRAFELYCRDLLREWGWDAVAVPMKAMKISGKIIMVGSDLFGADVLAQHTDSKPRYIQCTLHGAVTKRLDEVKRHKWCLGHQQVELWQKRDNGEVAVKMFNGTDFVDIGRIIRRKFYMVGSF